MADCRACGHPVQWVNTEARRIMLEIHPQAAGEDRYAIEELTGERVARLLEDDDATHGYPLHVCGRPVR